MAETLYIVKIGGNVVDNDTFLDQFLKDFSSINGYKILVHGGGKIATEIGKSLGIEAIMVDGRRITDADTLKLVTMVYGGLLNKKIVAKIQANGCNALGLTGADGNVIKGHKRAVKDIDYGFVGDIDNVNGDLLKSLLHQGFTPIMAPLSHDGNGNMLNTNADTIASVIAVEMAAAFNVQLVYCFELQGVLKDINDKNSIIQDIDFNHYQELKENGVIAKGMIPKMDNSFAAIRSGVSAVRICHAENLLEITKGSKLGTVLA